MKKCPETDFQALSVSEGEKAGHATSESQIHKFPLEIQERENESLYF